MLFRSIQLKAKKSLYINVGSRGNTYQNPTDSYNGGGIASTGSGAGGGGATHIATSSKGNLENFQGYQNELLLVAAGGGGYYGGRRSNGGANGGAGGGTGYIGNSLLNNKAMYCYSCEESSEESTKTISTTNTSKNPISNYVKKGNGYAKITLITKLNN